jgi:hypothetical protein
MRHEPPRIAEALIGKGFTPTHALAYHRTGRQCGNDINALSDMVNKIFKKFVSGDGDYYGRGLYTTGDKKSQIAVGGQNMIGYGLALIQYRITLKNILLFDYRLSEKVHPGTVTLEEQLVKMVPSLTMANMPLVFQVLSEDLAKTAQSSNKLVSADRCREVWNDWLRDSSSNFPRLYGSDDDLNGAYLAASRDPSFSAARAIAKSNNIHGVAFIGGNDGDVIVVYEKFVDSDAKAVKWCITDPRFPNDESHLLLDWRNAGMGISSAATDLADGLAKVRIPNSKSSFDAVFVENSSEMGVSGSVDFIRTNFRWLASPVLQFKSVDIAFLSDKTCCITGGQWTRGDCLADYFGRESEVTAQLKKAGKSVFSNSSSDIPVFHSGTFAGGVFSGIFSGGVFRKGIFNGLFKGGILDFDSGARWGDSATMDTSERSLKASIRYKGKIYAVPFAATSLTAFMKTIDAGMASAGTQITDESLSAAIQRQLPFNAAAFDIEDGWRGNKTIPEAFAAFKSAYPWLLNKSLRQSWKDAPSIKVTNDDIIVESGTFFTGTVYYSKYSKGVTVNGGVIDGDNIFEGKFIAGIYNKGMFNGIFTGGVFNLDSAIWGKDAEGKTNASVAVKVIFHKRYIDIIPETYFIPGMSGNTPLYRNFGEVLGAIRTGKYQKIVSELAKETEVAKSGKGPPPKLLTKATQYLQKLGIHQADDLGDDFSDEEVSDDDIAKLLAWKEPSKDKLSFMELFSNAFYRKTGETGAGSLGYAPEFIDLSEARWVIGQTGEAELKEKEYDMSDLSDSEQDRLYDVFRDSYIKSVGAAFDRDAFAWRAAGWIFFGNPPDDSNPEGPVGGIAVRRQQSNVMYKLVASFGDFRSILKGFDDFKSRHGNSPCWSILTPDIAKMVVKHDKSFKILPGPVVKAMEGAIKKLSNGEVQSVGLNGVLKVNTPAGILDKIFVGNTPYINWLLDSIEDPDNASRLPVPKAVISPVLGIIKALL